MRRPSSAAMALVAICALGAALRLIGLQFGLPSIYNPDEAAIMSRALSFAKGTLNPENFLYPTFYFYVLFAWVGLYLASQLLTGRADSIAALQHLYFASPSGIYTAGRTLGVITGTVTLAALYRLASTLLDRRAALAATLFLAVAPLHVRDSHYVKHDVPATLAVVAAYLAISRVWPSPRQTGPATKDGIMAGLACGAAFSTHYYCVFLALPLLLAVMLAWRPRGPAAVAKQVLVASGAAAVAFLALSPFIVLEPATAWRDITANREIVVDRAVSSGAFAPALRYAQMLWFDAAGIPVVALAAAGVLWMARVAPLRALWLLAFPIPFLLFITNTAPASRYLNPVLPFVALFAGWTLSQAAQSLRLRPLTFWAAAALVAAPGLLGSVRVGQFFRQEDTRTLAERYVHTNIPAGTTLAIQPHSVMFTPTRDSLVEALSRQQRGIDGASTKFRLQLALDPYPTPAYRLIYLGGPGLDPDKVYVNYDELGGSAGLAQLRANGVAFIIVKRYNNPDPATMPFLTALAREARRVAAFTPYRPGTTAAAQARIDPFLHNTDTPIDGALERPGPTLEIWDLNGGRP